uniref:Putative ovule protein n=1 Tax=Solanum chacoense TaxID=4108 RepID=A0A0V0GLR3_SOLCH
MKKIASSSVLYTYLMGHYLNFAALDLFIEDGAPFTVLHFKEFLGKLSILEFPVLKGYRQHFHY